MMMKKKNTHAQALGKLGGLARAKTLTPKQRLAISKLGLKAKAAKQAKNKQAP